MYTLKKTLTYTPSWEAEEIKQYCLGRWLILDYLQINNKETLQWLKINVYQPRIPFIILNRSTVDHLEAYLFHVQNNQYEVFDIKLASQPPRQNACITQMINAGMTLPSITPLIINNTTIKKQTYINSALIITAIKFIHHTGINAPIETLWEGFDWNSLIASAETLAKDAVGFLQKKRLGPQDNLTNRAHTVQPWYPRN